MNRNVTQAGSLIGGVAGALTSAAASICCIGPLALTLLGVNGAIIAAGIKPYRPYLLAASLVLIGAALWGVYRRKPAVAGAACDVRAGRIAKAVVWFALAIWVGAFLIGFAADRYWL
jgi:mercuric ion transport protein